MSEKVVNYTEEMVATLYAVYDPKADEEARKAQIVALAEELGKSPASIRAKLTREKLYVALVKAPAGKATVRKAQLVTAIASRLNVPEDIVGSLEKATKDTLKRVLVALTPATE